MPDRIRYLLIATHVPRSGSGGGIVRYTVELAGALHRRSDVELHVLVASAAPTYFDTMLPASQVHHLPRLPVMLRSLAERMLSVRALTGQDFDVVHGTKHILPGSSGSACRALTVHDMLPMDRPYDFNFAKRWLLRAPYLRSIRSSDVILCVSEATRARLLDYVPSVRGGTEVVPLAAASALKRVSPQPVKDLEGHSFGLVVSDSSGRKNLRRAIETWHDMRQTAPDAVLALVGPRDWRNTSLGDTWIDLTSEKRGVHLGNVTDAELRWCYQNADVVLCPSLLEGFGLPALEAATFGAPVITSDDPALCEASAGHAIHLTSRDARGWTKAVDTALSGRRRKQMSEAEPDIRSWDDVAAETYDSIIRKSSGNVAAERRDIQVPLRHRVGVDPYAAASLKVLHVVPDRTCLLGRLATQLTEAHKIRGWASDVVVDNNQPLPVEHYDGLVLYGLRAGRRRGQLPGPPPTILVAGEGEPRTAFQWLREAGLARHTNAVVLACPADAPRWSRIPVPITQISLDDQQRAIDPDEFAAVLLRAGVWGVASRGY